MGAVLMLRSWAGLYAVVWDCGSVSKRIQKLNRNFMVSKNLA